MQEHETHYILTKEEMLKLSTFAGDAIWRLHRAEILDVGVQPMILVLICAISFLFNNQSQSLWGVYSYWGLLIAVGSFYVFARYLWKRNNRAAWQEYAKKEMILGMEEAQVKYEINHLTREIEHGSDLLGE